jgi:hypothetical protein
MWAFLRLSVSVLLWCMRGLADSFRVSGPQGSKLCMWGTVCKEGSVHPTPADLCFSLVGQQASQHRSMHSCMQHPLLLTAVLFVLCIYAGLLPEDRSRTWLLQCRAWCSLGISSSLRAGVESGPVHANAVKLPGSAPTLATGTWSV